MKIKSLIDCLPLAAKLIFPTVLLSSCAHKGISPDATSANQKSSGYWEGKAYVKDLDRGSVNQIYWTAFAEWPGKLRMDITGDFGLNLASMGMQDNNLQLALFRERKYVSGPAKEDSLLALTKVAINPAWINNALFDRPIDNKSWTCVQAKDGLPESCERLKDNFQIQWKDRKGEIKRFVMKYKNHEIIFYVTEFKTKVQPKSNPYQIAAPADFEKISVQ